MSKLCILTGVFPLFSVWPVQAEPSVSPPPSPAWRGTAPPVPRWGTKSQPCTFSFMARNSSPRTQVRNQVSALHLLLHGEEQLPQKPGEEPREYKLALLLNRLSTPSVAELLPIGRGRGYPIFGVGGSR